MNKKYVILISIVLLFTLCFITYRNITLQRAKNDMLNTQLKELQASDELVLIRVIKEKKEQIKTLENMLKETEETLKKANAYESCYKTQLDRLVNNLEYNLNYCTDDNLKQFNPNL